MTLIKKKGLKYFLALTFFIPVFISSISLAQTASKISCLLPYEITFTKEHKEGVQFKYVEYESHDDHTFWYRINLDDNLKFSYEISSLDNLNNFDVYFYQYDGNTFCRAFIRNNLELISFDKKFEYKGTKGSTYYIGIFPMEAGGCGHKIKFLLGEG